MSDEINIIALVKGEDRYVFLFDDNHRTDTLRMLGRYAADPELSFSWYDAAILSQRIRSMAPIEMAEETNRPRIASRSVARFKMPEPKDKH